MEQTEYWLEMEQNWRRSSVFHLEIWCWNMQNYYRIPHEIICNFC